MVIIAISVGVGGKNLTEHVETIQSALNRFTSTNPKLAVTGKADAATLASIVKLQKTNLGLP